MHCTCAGRLCTSLQVRGTSVRLLDWELAFSSSVDFHTNCNLWCAAHMAVVTVTVNRRMDEWRNVDAFDLVGYQIEISGGEDGRCVETLHPTCFHYVFS